jgi:hypothetical protein
MRKEKIFISLIGFIFVFTMLSGAARKWIFNGSQFNSLLFFIQFISPLLMIFMGHFRLEGLSLRQKDIFKMQQELTQVLVVYALSLVVFALNPKSQTIFHGMLGFVLHLSFWFFVFRFIQFRHQVTIDKLIPLFIAMSIAEVGLGIVQYNLPVTHYLNYYNDMRSTNNVIALVGDRVRVTGSFSYLSGFTSFLMFYAFLLVYMIATQYTKFIYIVPLVLLGIVGVFISGSRGAFGIYFFILVFGLLGLRQFNAMIRFVGAAVFVAALFVTALLLTGKGQGLVDFVEVSGANFRTRYELNKDVEQKTRILSPIQNVFNFRGKYPIYGVGLGATYQGATQQFGTSYYVEEFGYYEEEAERIILEGGYLLLTLKVILCFILIRHLTISPLFSIPLVFLTLIYIPVVYNVYNIIFWGMGIMLMELAQKKLSAKRSHPVITGRPNEEDEEDHSLSTIPSAQPTITEGPAKDN